MGSQGTSIDFEALRPLIPRGRVLLPGSEEYVESIQRWSAAIVKQAAVVVKPTDANEVSAAVKFATSHKLPFAVKCGGHATSGVSSCENGMVVDLGLMRSTSVDPEAKLITFGGGCRWADIDNALWKHGLATVGGTVSDTGVGGLILGGGYGFLSPKQGLSIDCLVKAEVVTADGKILTASETEHADLFWALRGAGQNFAVATSFTMRAFDQGRVYSGLLAFPLTALPSVVEFANKLIDLADDNSAFVFGASHLPPNLEPGIMAIVFYNGPEAQAREFYKPLLDIAIFSTAKQVDWPTVNSQLGQVPDGRKWRRLQGGATFVPPLKLETVKETFDEFLPFVAEQGMKDSTMIIYEIMPNKKIREVAPTATAFAGRDDAYHISTVWQWEDPSQDTLVRQKNRKMVTRLKESGVREGVTQYNNYDTGGATKPENAFGVNLERLREIKARYDPDNVFFKWVSLYPRAAGDKEEDS